MELTGKAKEAFEKWYIETECKDLNLLGEIRAEFRMFYNVLTDSMKYGVYVDFADSVGYELHAFKIRTDEYRFEVEEHKKTNNLISSGIKTTRPEARTAAIEKFNEIYNERNT